MIVNDTKTLLREQQWVERLKRGDEKAFRHIYDLYHSRIYYFSLRFLDSGDAAKEIVQEVFVKLWTHRGDIKPDLSLQGYLYTIARHLNYKALQQRARQLALHQEMIYRSTDRYDHAADDMVYDEYLKIAEDAVEQLSPHRKLVFRMAWKQGMSAQEISRDLDISVSTVKNHLVEARKCIKQHLLLNADLSAGLLLFVNVALS